MIYALSIVHGVFNVVMMVLFFSMARLGLRIRGARRHQAPPPVPSIRRHRKHGPLFTILGAAGFLFGFALVAASGSRLILFPAHFTVGLTIVVLLLATYAVSRFIKRPVSPFRTPHFVIGVAILILYIGQTFLGLSLLF